MMTTLRLSLAAFAAVVALSGAACGDHGSEPVAETSRPDTTLTDPHEVFIPPTGQATAVPTRKTAADYPMQYWISVPAGWPGNRTWPVVVNMPGSGKNYEDHANIFAAARDKESLPFILVTPVTLANSGDALPSRNSPAYQYPASTWDLIDKVGRCEFDEKGVAAIIAEVRKSYAGQSKAFLTGFSGGGHPAWSFVFLKPELLRAVAPASPNYNGRCVTRETSESISTAPERVTLPIRTFMGAKDGLLSVLTAQSQSAIDLGRANGYTIFSTTIVPNIGHDPMAASVLDYFYGLLSATERR